MSKKVLNISTVLFVLMFLVSPVVAVPTTIWYEDGPQDPLLLPQNVHELGDQLPFPDEEWIYSSWTFTNFRPCLDPNNPDNTSIPNIEVSITNMTKTYWRDLYYVGDAGQEAGGLIFPETFLSNDDGIINGGLAFKIDDVGINIPLVFESIAADLIFEPGETWRFVIQDYGNAFGGAPTPFDSIGVGIGSSGFPFSTGSIIAVIPEPATLAVLLVGAFLGLAGRRR